LVELLVHSGPFGLFFWPGIGNSDAIAIFATNGTCDGFFNFENIGWIGL